MIIIVISDDDNSCDVYLYNIILLCIMRIVYAHTGEMDRGRLKTLIRDKSPCDRDPPTLLGLPR